MRALTAIGLLGILLLGCGGEIELNGATYPIESDSGFYARWLLAVALAFIGLSGAIFAFDEEEVSSKGAKIGILLGAFGSVVVGIICYPGLTSYSELSRQEAQSHAEAHSQAKAEAATEKAKAIENSPIGQYKSAIVARDRLSAKVADELLPLSNKYTEELTKHKTGLPEALKKSGFTTHEMLLRAGPEFEDVRNQLKRVAVLRHSIGWIATQISEQRLRESKLDQQAWELKKIDEMQGVADSKQMDEIKRIITKAEAMVNVKFTPPAVQDIDRAQAELFDELIKQ